MLSKRTATFLEGWAELSDLAYPEGGMVFRYQYAHKQAHCFLKGNMRDALYIDVQTHYSETPERTVNDLGRFLQGALGHYTKEAATDHAIQAARTLIEYLKEDLQYDLIHLVVEDGNYDMTAAFDMANKARNDYSMLELFWSVD